MAGDGASRDDSLVSVAVAHVSPDEIRQSLKRPIGELRDEVAQLSKDLTALMTGIQKLQLIRDRVVISYADG